MIYHLFENTLQELFTRRYSVLLSIGFLMSIYYASQGINTLLIAFNQSYQVELDRGPIKQRLLSLGVFLIMITLFLAAVSLSVFGNIISGYVNFEEIVHMSPWLFNGINFIGILILVMLAISILYHFGHPGIKKFQFINPGTSFATVVILLASWGLSFYFSQFDTYNKIYGSIGSLLVALVWLNTVSYVLIIGFELYTKADKIRRIKNS